MSEKYIFTILTKKGQCQVRVQTRDNTPIRPLYEAIQKSGQELIVFDRDYEEDKSVYQGATRFIARLTLDAYNRGKTVDDILQLLSSFN